MPQFQLTPDMLGWRNDPKAVEAVLATLPRPLFGAATPHLVGNGAGKTVLLYNYTRQVYGRDIILTQKRGVCVSKGWALGVDVIRSVGVLMGNNQQVNNTTASEPIYAGARIEIGKERSRGDGAVGAWAAKWVVDYGTLERGVYGKYDLSKEDDNIAVTWGAPGRGCPPEIEQESRLHPVKDTSLITSYEEARDAIANFQPVMVCSDRGFSMSRDQDGFARPEGTWGHCMCFIAVDDGFKRPGLLCMNSWGPDWIGGAKRHDQPDGSFWVDADVADRMLKEGDSFTATDVSGYPRRVFKHHQI